MLITVQEKMREGEWGWELVSNFRVAWKCLNYSDLIQGLKEWNILKKIFWKSSVRESSEGQVPEARTFLKCLWKSKKVSVAEESKQEGEWEGRRSAQIKSLWGLIDLCNLVFSLFLIVRSQVFGGFFFEPRNRKHLSVLTGSLHQLSLE